MTDPRDDRKPDYRSLALAGTAVTELVAPVLLGVWIDHQFNTGPWGLVVGVTVGFVGGIAHLMMIVSRTDPRDKKTGG